MFGPILTREWLVAPRKVRFYAQRVIFVLALFSLVCTAWALLAGIQQVRNVGDLSRFGALVFQIVVPLQLIIVMFLSAVTCASAVSHEKDKRTLILLLLTRLSSSQIVLGKLSSCLIGIYSLILAALPLLLLIAILGGVSVGQVLMATAICVVTTSWCGALANLVAFWREKTFQTLAITMITIVGWPRVLRSHRRRRDTRHRFPVGRSSQPRSRCLGSLSTDPSLSWIPLPGGLPIAHSLLGAVVTLLFCGVAIWRLRVWNPSQQVRPQAPEPDENYDVPASGNSAQSAHSQTDEAKKI